MAIDNARHSNIESHLKTLNSRYNNIESHLKTLNSYIACEIEESQTIAELHRQIVKKNNTIRNLEYELYLERKHSEKTNNYENT